MQRPAFLDPILSIPPKLVFESAGRLAPASISHSFTPALNADEAMAALARVGLHDEDLSAFYRFCDGGDIVHIEAHDPAGRGLFIPSVRLFSSLELDTQTDSFHAWFEFTEEQDRPPSYDGIAIGEATETGNLFIAVPDGSSVTIFFFDHDDPTPNHAPLAFSFREFMQLLASEPYAPLLLISGMDRIVSETDA